MEKKGFTPLQAALITFIVVFVLAPVVSLPILELFAYVNMDVQFSLFAALVCGAFAWVFVTIRSQRAYIAVLHEQIDLLTDQANLLAEHINALEAAGDPASSPAAPTSTPEKD